MKGDKVTMEQVSKVSIAVRDYSERADYMLSFIFQAFGGMAWRMTITINHALETGDDTDINAIY